MKRTAKRWIVVAAVAVVVLGILGYFLLFRHHGDEECGGQTVTEKLILLNGGVEMVFGSAEGTPSLNESQLNAAKAILQKRLVLQNVLNGEICVDTAKGQLVARVPLEEGGEIKFLQKAVKEAGRLGRVTFRMDDEEILNSDDMVSAKAVYDEDHDIHTVQITLTESGKAVFAAATTQQMNNGTISVWLDDQMVCNPTVNAPITDGVVAISVDSSALAEKLASIINSGPMPIALEVKSSEFLGPDMVLDSN